MVAMRLSNDLYEDHEFTQRDFNEDGSSEIRVLRDWINIYDLSGTARDPTHPGYLAQVFVDTGDNCNTISRALFKQLIDRGLVSEFVKGPESGVGTIW